MHNTQGAYQGLTIMHTPMDIRHTAQQCAKLGLKRPILLRAANTFLHLLPPTRLLLIRSLQGEQTLDSTLVRWLNVEQS